MGNQSKAAGAATIDESQWAIEQLDMGVYLDRIGVTEAEASGTDADTLRYLHQRHVHTFPFENIDQVLRSSVDVGMGALNAKVVERRRGGGIASS